MRYSAMPCLQDSMSMELQIRSSVRDRYASTSVIITTVYSCMYSCMPLLTKHMG